MGAVRTAFGMQGTGLVSYAAALLILGRWPTVESGQVPFAVVLGVLGVISVSALYRALALGPIAVVAPVVASYVAITVLLVVVFLGERLSPAQAIAAGVVFVGVVATSTGGMTSHAAVVARGMGKPCVAGAGDVRIDGHAGTLSVRGITVKTGETITLDGSTGEIILGTVPTVLPYTETYLAIRQGVVQGGPFPLSLLQSSMSRRFAHRL